MHSFDAGLRQRVQVPHAVAGQVGKGLVGAAMIRGNRAVTYAEGIASMMVRSSVPYLALSVAL
jgi:hypothetical protein